MIPARIELKIDNKEVPAQIVESLELTQILGNHHRFVIELRRRQELENAFGKSLESNLGAWLSKTVNLRIVSADSSGDDKGDIKFIGVVTEVNFSSKVNSLGNVRISGYSPTVILDLYRIHRIWCDVSSSAIINQLISDEGLPNVNVSASGGTSHAGFLAYGDTPFSLINYLAGFEGWWAYYDGQNYHVSNDLPDDKIELKANHLSSFSVGLDSKSLRDLSGSSFEYKQGAWFSSSGPNIAPPGIPLGKTAWDSERLSKTRESVISSHNPKSQRDLDRRLETITRKTNAGLLRSSGTTDRLGLYPGKGLSISWEPKKRVTDTRREEGFNGLYLLSKVVHIYKDAKYSCGFNAVARDLAYPYYDEDNFPHQIIEKAWVVDNSDPEANKLGAVKVRFDWRPEGSDGVESPFIRVCQPFAGSDGEQPHGAWFVPEIGDGVLVSIRGRHLENAAVIGSLYDGSHLPRNDLYTDDNTVKAFHTKGGNEIIFNDSNDKEQIVLRARDDTCSVIMDASKNDEKVSIAVKKDGASIVLDGSSGNEKISLTSKGSACEISVDGANSSVKISADRSITLKASEIILDGQSKISLDSKGQIKQKAGATLDIDGGGVANIKGGIVKIN